ncbi:MAG: recombinase family protein [Bacteroidetes bacterium]|nr:recombinase family protein [Bacteroidota bacterium]
MKKYVSYTRCSTLRQGQSGLGLEAQRQAVNNFAKDGEIIAEFVEVETGTSKKKRVEIYKAIEMCKQTGATLLIAKLDRLARNVAFTASLLESKVPFVACDAPFATPLTIHILSAVAENEAKLIADRTSKSLQVAKQRGVKLGTPENLTQEARLKGAARKKELALANENNVRAGSLIELLRKEGISFQRIAWQLNKNGFLTSRGKQHSAYSVWLINRRNLSN